MTTDVWGEGDDELVYAQGRVPERTYVSSSFPIDRENSRDYGQPARFVHKVFDTDTETTAEFDGTQWVICETEKGRYQFKLLVAREAGQIKELWIQRVPTAGTGGKIKLLLNLRRPEVDRLVELLRNLEHIPIEGNETIRVDDALVRELFANPSSLVSVYKKNPERFRQLISDDESARDVIAVSHRRNQVAKFERLLGDDDYFDGEVSKIPDKKPEKVWQRFFEDNPWILGVSLAGQLLTSWSNERLEQVVAGAYVAGVGKRTDALLRTSGRIKSMVFAEIKTHRTALLSKDLYRSGCWPPSEEVTGGVVQSQGTVHRAVRQIGERLQDTVNGADLPGEFTYLLQPRSFLIAGNLSELLGETGGDNQDKIRSFELYRRQLIEPEILTFDELLARARWYLASSENEPS